MNATEGRFSSLTLRAKLLLFNLATVAVALTTMVAVMAGSEWQHAKRLLLSDTRTQAQVLGDAASAALAFNDRRGAEEILLTLRWSPHVRAGILYGADGSELAGYRPAGQTSLPPPRADLQAEGHVFGEDLLDVFLPVFVDGHAVGHILLRADFSGVQARLRWTAVATTTAAALALAIALLLSRRLREVVAGPILRLAQVTREISALGDYSRRARVEGRDEVATLARDFNSMIEQIERRNQALIHELEQRRTAEARLDHLAHFDTLTGLPNRRHFQNRIEAAVSLAVRFNEAVSLMFVDLDNFKYVNDTLGHEVGDELLRHVGRTLPATLRANVIVCRLGGDEFAVIIDGADDLSLAGLASKLIEVLARPIQLGGHGIRIGCSIGIARCPTDCAGAEALVRAADAAMYDAKAAGKNTFRFFHHQLQERSERHLRLESALREALVAGQGLELHYQPVLSAAANRIVAVEALCRWQHPEVGRVSPDEFIPLAEESDLILQLGAWVLHTACRQGAAWERSGQPLLVAINVSGRQCRDPDFFDGVCRTLAITGFSPNLLEIELTESVLMDGHDELAVLFGKLRRIGVRIALDDFGTGYSSLSYLKRLPLDKLKIDKSFVRDLPHDADDRSIARAIVALARSLNLRTQAEGVENSMQLQYLAGLGCEYIQGYHVSRPLPVEELEAFLARPDPFDRSLGALDAATSPAIAFTPLG